jgi:cephalosporin hydroxylase
MIRNVARSIMGFWRNEMSTVRTLWHRRIYVGPGLEKEIVRKFHRFYYDQQLFDGTWYKTFWLGVLTKKCPLDLWIYQEIIFEIKPDIIIECGTSTGGSALFLACMCDLINNGKVISIDIERKEGRPKHRRINYLLGSSISREIVDEVGNMVGHRDKVMVVLDSDHSKDHVLRELRMYKNFVTKGSFLIVEDTNINGHPVAKEFGLGPWEAVEEFLRENKSFVADRSREKFFLTFNPKGYLKKLE